MINYSINCQRKRKFLTFISIVRVLQHSDFEASFVLFIQSPASVRKYSDELKLSRYKLLNLKLFNHNLQQQRWNMPAKFAKDTFTILANLSLSLPKHFRISNQVRHDKNIINFASRSNRRVFLFASLSFYRRRGHTLCNGYFASRDRGQPWIETDSCEAS